MNTPFTLFLRRNANVLFFVGGFVFDSITLTRIDSVLDLLWQFVYLAAITVLIIAQARLAQGRWTPSGWVGRWWHHETEVLHFCYGGLLSGYVIFYFKSTSFSRSLVFLSLITALMFLNEMPQIKRLGHRMRIGLYAFCVASYLNYLFPVIIGRMGWWVFLLALISAGGITYLAIKEVARYTDDPRRSIRALSVSPSTVLLLILSLYTLKLIPPVPLSARHIGIYRDVERLNGHYRLSYRRPPWVRFWQTDNRVFPARPGDKLLCFLSVFGPRRFTHEIFVHWSQWDPASRRWVTSDRISMPITGGRGDGYRGYVYKQHYGPGRWRVQIETEDERVLGQKTFLITTDDSTDPRRFASVVM